MTSPAAICPILIERDRELALLHRIASEVASGSIARLVVVTGEGGAGKSRLIAEVIADLDDTWTKIITSASSARRPFADVIAAAAVGPDTPHVEIGRALAAAAPSGPTAIVVDDAHLLDEVTLRAFGVALDLLHDRSVLVLVGFRDATPPLAELRRHPSVVDIPLRPLSPDGLAAMANALERHLDAEQLGDIMRRSGGNPFFAEELLQSPDADVSWSVTDAVCDRVRCVGDKAVRVANIVAVATIPVPTNVLTDLEPGSGLHDLLRANVVVDDHGAIAFRHALIGESLRRQLAAPERTTLHARLAERFAQEPDPPASEIAHHWLDAGDRSRAAHWAAIAAQHAATERRYTTASDLYEVALLDPPDDELARAELLERGAIAAMWARQGSVGIVRATEADRLFHTAGVPWRAAAMWLNPSMRSLPKPEIDASALERDSVAALLAASGQACRARSYREAAELAREALGKVIASDDVLWELEVASQLVRAGELVEGEAFVRRRMLTARIANDVFAVGRCESALTEMALAAGDIDACIDHQLRAIALLSPDDPVPWTYHVGLALSYAVQGDLELAHDRVDRALALGDLIGTQFAQLPMAWIDLEEDRFDDARARIAEMAGTVRALGVPTYTRAVLVVEARLRHRLGELDAAMALLDEAESVSGDLFEYGRPDLLIERARVAADLGRSDIASDVANDLQELIDRGATNMIAAALDWTMGLWSRVAGQTDEACRRIEAAAIGMEAASRWTLAAEAWIDLAELAPAATASNARSRAAAICDERGLTWVRRRLDALGAPPAPQGPAAFAKLTPRQRDIAVLVAQGRSNQEIADQLFLSVHTVRNQLVAIFDVLGVSRRAEIAAMAADRDIASRTRDSRT